MPAFQLAKGRRNMPPKIAVILVNFNGQQDTLECLASLQQEGYPNKQVIVVDNDSSDDSVAVIRAAYPDAVVVETGDNLGFTGGNNVGMARGLELGADYLFLLNNDTTIVPGSLDALTRCARSHPDAAAITPAIYYFSNPSNPWFMGSALDRSSFQTSHVETDVRAEGRMAPFAIPWANGCGMFMPADKMREIGNLDERCFLYCEDVDWSLRAIKSGYTCLLCPESVVYHKVSSASKHNSPKQMYYMHRNTCLIIAKHTQGLQKAKALALRTRKCLGYIAYCLQHLSEQDYKHQMRALLLAMADFSRSRFGRCPYV